MSRGILKIFPDCSPKAVLFCRESIILNSFNQRNIVKLISSAMLLTLTACASPMIGRALPERNYPNFTNGTKGYHYISFERTIAELEYDWHINAEDSTLNLKGHYEILSGLWELKYPLKKVKLTLEAYLLNENYEIVEVEYIYHVLYEDRDFEKEIKIDKTFPYKQEYKYITFKLSYAVDYYSE